MMDLKTLNQWISRKAAELSEKLKKSDADNIKIHVHLDKVAGKVKYNYGINPLVVKKAITKYKPVVKKVNSDIERARQMAATGQWSRNKLNVWYVTYFLERGLTPDLQLHAEAAALPDIKKRKLVTELRKELGRRLEF